MQNRIPAKGDNKLLNLWLFFCYTMLLDLLWNFQMAVSFYNELWFRLLDVNKTWYTIIFNMNLRFVWLLCGVSIIEQSRNKSWSIVTLQKHILLFKTMSRQCVLEQAHDITRYGRMMCWSSISYFELRKNMFFILCTTLKRGDTKMPHPV